MFESYVVIGYVFYLACDTFSKNTLKCVCCKAYLNLEKLWISFLVTFQTIQVVCFFKIVNLVQDYFVSNFYTEKYFQ